MIVPVPSAAMMIEINNRLFANVVRHMDAGTPVPVLSSDATVGGSNSQNGGQFTADYNGKIKLLCAKLPSSLFGGKGARLARLFSRFAGRESIIDMRPLLTVDFSLFLKDQSHGRQTPQWTGNQRQKQRLEVALEDVVSNATASLRYHIREVKSADIGIDDLKNSGLTQVEASYLTGLDAPSIAAPALAALVMQRLLRKIEGQGNPIPRGYVDVMHDALEVKLLQIAREAKK